MARASCLCGTVTWEIEGDLKWMSHCHCSRCRKTHGSAYATFVAGSPSGCRMPGTEHVVKWASSPTLARCFCAQCGSVVPGDPIGDLVFLPAGNFEDDPGVRALAHIFAGSKAPWFEITDELP